MSLRSIMYKTEKRNEISFRKKKRNYQKYFKCL